jgi:hypothetical protein
LSRIFLAFGKIHVSKFTSLGPFHNELGHVVVQSLSSHSLGLLLVSKLHLRDPHGSGCTSLGVGLSLLLVNNLHWNHLLGRFLGAVITLLGALSLFFECAGSLRLQEATKPSQIGLLDQVSEVGMLVLDVNIGQILLSEGSAAAGALIGCVVLAMSCNLHDEGANLSYLYHMIIRI